MSTFVPGGGEGGPISSDGATDPSSSAPTASTTPRSVADILRSGGLPSVEQLKAELERQGLPDAVPLVIEAAVKRPPVVSNPARIIPSRTNRVLFAPLSSEAGTRPELDPPAAREPSLDSPAPGAPGSGELAGSVLAAAPSGGSAALAEIVGDTEEIADEPAVDPDPTPVSTPVTTGPVPFEPPAAPSPTAPALGSASQLAPPTTQAPAQPPSPAQPPTPIEPPRSAETPAPVQAAVSTAEPPPAAAPTPAPTPTPALAGDASAPLVALDSPAAAPVAPTLAPHTPRAPRPRPARSPAVDRPAPTPTVTAPAGRRRGRRAGFKALLTLVVLGGLAAGAILVVQRFVLAKAWPAEWKELASFVETQTGLTYDHSVPVRDLPSAEFAVRAAAVRLDLPLDGGQVDAADRAMGLWEGTYDPLAGARAAAAVWPAVYDPSADVVYVDAGAALGGQRDAFVARELTMALYDQRFGWSRAIADLGPSQRLAYRAGLEGEATVVATAWLARSLGGDPSAARASQPLGAPTPPAAVWAGLPGSLGLAARVPSTLGPMVVRRAAPTPGAAPAQPGPLDAGLYGWSPAPSASAPVPSLAPGEQPAGTGVAGPRGTMGPGYWFAVLASRLEPSLAWLVASTWAGDQTVTVMRGEQVCVRSSVVPADGQLDSWQLALSEWAVRGPAEATPEVAVSDGHLNVLSCDPGPDADSRVDVDAVGALLAYALDQLAAAPAAEAG